jgi:MFS transporter, DHA3 family, macrolide efflux protein
MTSNPSTTTTKISRTPENSWHLRFWSIWIGQSFSLIGSALTQFVLLWWITLNVGTTTALAAAGVAALLPQALLSPVGGAVADRFSRRMIMIVADTVAAICMLVLVWLFRMEQVQLWHLYTIMAIRSSTQAFQAPAAAASTAMLVPEAWLDRVAGLNQVLQGIRSIAAAPLGALLLAFLPFEDVLMVDIATAVLGIAPLLFFTIPQTYRGDTEQTSMVNDFLTGARVVLNNRGLMLLYSLAALVVMTIMPTFTLTPLLIKEQFGGGVNEVAFIEGLSGIGIIVGGAFIAVRPLFRRRIVTVLISFAISCAMVAFTALTPGSMLWLAAVWWTVSGVTFSMGNAPMMAIIQSNVPNAFQGRVIAFLYAVMGLAAPVGLVLAAPLGELIGVKGIFVIGGLTSAAICLLGFASPRLLRIEEGFPREPWHIQPTPNEHQKHGDQGCIHN